MNTQDQIRMLLEEHRVVLFMKGSPMFPQCGFSAQVAAILGEYDVPFHAVNVLLDEAVREGIKVYGNWPTIPQLYVSGELIGGCDIITSLHEQSQLAQVLA